MQPPNPPDIVQIRKLITSPEDWDGKVQGDPCSNRPEENGLLSPSNSPCMKSDPLQKQR